VQIFRSPIFAHAASLHLIGEHERRWLTAGDTHSSLILAFKVDVFEVEGVEMARKKAEEAEDNVDDQVGAATGYDEHSDWWDCGRLLEKM